MFFVSPPTVAPPLLTTACAMATPHTVSVHGNRPATERLPAATLVKHRRHSDRFAWGAAPDTMYARKMRRLFRRQAALAPPPFAGFATLRTSRAEVHISPYLEGGASTKYHLGIKSDGALVGVRQVRIAEKPDGRRPVASTRCLTYLPLLQFELSLLRAIDSPLTPYAVYTVDEKLYQLVEPMAGDLLSFMRLVDTLDEDDVRVSLRAAARSVFAQTTKQLVHLHEVGVMHRDIKPDNILWDGTGRVTVADFGHAHQGRTCAFTVPMGTLKYRAPELALSVAGRDSYTHKSDVFSLGVTLASIFADSDLLPMARASMPAEEAEAARDFNAWRISRSVNRKGTGRLDWKRIACGAKLPGAIDVWHDIDLFAYQFRKGDARLCDFVFDTMLLGNPDDRQHIVTLGKFGDTLSAQCMHESNQLFAWAAQQNSERAQTEQALRDYANHV